MANASKIEDIIDEIEAYIDDCKPSAFSTSKIIVNKDEIESLLQELRTKTPDEIRKYQRMIANREQILADARAKADEIISQAQIQTNELVSEHQIMQQAYAQANEVILIAQKNAQEKIDRATEDANNIRMGAIAYTDELLANIQTILANSIETTRTRTDSFLSTMQVYLDTVDANRASLVPDSLNDGATDPASSLEPSADVSVPEEPRVEAPQVTNAASSDDEVPALDIPEQFFNKE
jgi:cell division septum initiation protein DivIVA